MYQGANMGLRAYVLKRTIFSLLIIYVVMTINFVVFLAMPGDPVGFMADKTKMKPEVAEMLIERFGLNQPLHVRYAKYVVNILTGQFGVSYFTQRPIAEEIGSRLQNTLLLVVPAEIMAIMLGIVLGALAGYKRGGKLDSAAVITSLTTYSLPVFWVGMLLILVFFYQLRWLPGGHSIPDSWLLYPPTNIWVEISGRLLHLILPWVTLILISYGGYLLLARASVLEVVTEDYINTARAKGLKERTILFKHALKNALLPIITQVAIVFGFMLSGAIVTEQVFSYPGLGQWIWKSIETFDYPALQAIFFIIALCIVVANFIADLLYGVIDPRVKYE